MFKIFRVPDCDFSLSFLTSSLFCHYPSSRLLINTEIFEKSIHVSLLSNTVVAKLKTYSTQNQRSQKTQTHPKLDQFIDIPHAVPPLSHPNRITTATVHRRLCATT